MQCNECKKRPATLHLTQIINGKKTEVQVCELCAKKLGYMNHNEDAYSLHDLLSGLFNIGPSQLDIHENPLFEEVQELECPKCHLTFKEFQRIGKFGCAECYDTFKPKLDAVFRRVHSGNTKHHGKFPARKESGLHKKKQLEEYRSLLKNLIEQEEFEQAAIVRDKIKGLEQKELGDK